MFVMYVDESGDTGLIKSPSRYFVLAALVVHELRWTALSDEMVAFRREMRARFGLRMRTELHAFKFISQPGLLSTIPKHDRLAVLRILLDRLAAMTDLNIFAVVVDKQNKPAGYDVFDIAWKALVQRFENTMSHRNFKGPANADERGILFPDNGEQKRLTTLIRKMRVYNPIPHKPGHQAALQSSYQKSPLVRIIEDPSFRDSEHSLIIQSVDAVAYFLHQQFDPNAYMRKKSAQNYFARLGPILANQVSKSEDGIVRL